MSFDSRLPCLFIPHGGGPCFFMDGPPPFARSTWEAMGTYLRAAGTDLPRRPAAILVISGHWDEREPTVNTATEHSLYFDYYGFPEHTYQLQYPAKGSPAVAARVRALLADAGIASSEEASRGLDHGVFVPFLLMFPEADIPIVQLSLRSDMDAAAHLAIGQALQSLRDENVLIVGSGMSYHNLRDMRAPEGDAAAAAFDCWLTQAVTDPDPSRRHAKLAAWADAPSALACHPEPEHLLALHVAAGAAGSDIGQRVYSDRIMGKAVSAFQFG